MARTLTVRRGSPKPLFLALTIALAFILPPTAHASGWTGLQDVSDLTHTSQPPALVQIGVDSAGDAFEAQLVDKGPPQFAEVATRPAGSSWTTTQDLGNPSSNTGGP